MKTMLGNLLICVLLLLLQGSSMATTYLDTQVIGSGPYYMDRPGETYVLTQDISTPGTALVFSAEDVTLDLGGHTVTFGTANRKYRYGVAIPPHYQHGSRRWKQSDITIWQRNDGATIKNGAIEQSTTRADSCGCIFSNYTDDVTIQGTSLLVYGDDSFAMLLRKNDRLVVFDNTIVDSTKVISNRHQGRAAIDINLASSDQLEVFNNTIHNCRQWGIRLSREGTPDRWGHVYNNNIYPNVIVTNGYGIGIHGDKVEVYDNTITATRGLGIHVGEGADNTKIHDNTITVTCEPIWPEYERFNAHGIALERSTNAEVYNNHIISNGIYEIEAAASNGCALKVGVNPDSDNYVHDNIFEARHLGGRFFDRSFLHIRSSALFTDEFGLGDVRIENNTFISQDRFVDLYTWTGPNLTQADASEVVIKGNRWIRQEPTQPTRGNAINICGASIKGLRFIDNAGGDFKNNVRLGWRFLPNDWSIGSTITIKALGKNNDPIQGVALTVYDKLERLAGEATTNELGEAVFVLDTHTIHIEGEGEERLTEIIDLSEYKFSAIFPGDSTPQHLTFDLTKSHNRLTFTRQSP